MRFVVALTVLLLTLSVSAQTVASSNGGGKDPAPPTDPKDPLPPIPNKGPGSMLCGLMIGLTAAMRTNAVDVDGRGDVHYWLHHWEIKAAQTSALIDMLNKTLPILRDETTRFGVGQTARNMGEATVGGRGDVHYWTNKVAQQTRILRNASQDVGALQVGACSDKR